MNRLKILHAPQFYIWLVGVSFVLFQFFLQLSSGVIISAIMNEMALSAFTASLLSSAFYYVYTSLQIPAGLLFDKYNARLILTSTALICSAGCFIFSHPQNIFTLFIGRVVIGTGSAFAFVGLSHLLRQHFSMHRFGFLIGLSETLGFLATMAGIIGLGLVISFLGWRDFINLASLAGIFIAYCAWRFIPAQSTQKREKPPAGALKTIMKCRIQWINGSFVGLGFSIITVFAAMWAIPFIQEKLHCSLELASLIDSMIFLGAAISCPLFGHLANKLERRNPLMALSCFLTGILFLAILYIPITDAWLFSFLLFLVGLSCGAYMLSYTIANELAPPGAMSTSTGFTNTLAILSAPIMQLLVGYLLDSHTQTPHVYQISDYQSALLILPISLFLAAFLVIFLPEKTKEP